MTDAEERNSRRTTWVRIGLGALAVPALLTGTWAVFAPRSWYSDFGGNAPPSAFGAYNEHFVQDLGAGFLAVGAVLAFAALWPRREVVRLALVAFVVHTVPHFVVHLISKGELDQAGYLGINGALLFELLVAVWVWVMSERAYPVGSDSSRASTAARA